MVYERSLQVGHSTMAVRKLRPRISGSSLVNFPSLDKLLKICTVQAYGSVSKE